MATKSVSKKKPAKKPVEKDPSAPPLERRIYVLVPDTVQIREMPKNTGKRVEGVWTRHMSAGRLMAQVGHVVTQCRLDAEVLERHDNDPITTVVLSVRNSLELNKITMAMESDGIRVFCFSDHNPEFYNTEAGVTTAACTAPVYRHQVEPYLNHLELYQAPGERSWL